MVGVLLVCAGCSGEGGRFKTLFEWRRARVVAGRRRGGTLTVGEAGKWTRRTSPSVDSDRDVDSRSLSVGK